MGEKERKPPFHIINRHSGKHLGPFSTEIDAALARSIDTMGLGWSNGDVLDRREFDNHLDRLTDDRRR